MDNDINTPRAIASLFDLAREINKSKEIRVDVSKAQSTLINLASILGLNIQSTNQKQDISNINATPVIRKIHKHLLETGLHELADIVKSEAINTTSFTNQSFEIEHKSNEIGEFINDQSILIDILIKARNKSRILKEFETGDKIRLELEKSGILLEDTPSGTIWKLK